MQKLALVQVGAAAAFVAGLLVGGCAAFFPLDDLSGGKAPADGMAPTTDGNADAASTSAYRAAVMGDMPLLYLRLNEKAGNIAVDEMGRFNGMYSSSGISYGVTGALSGDPGNTAVQFMGGMSGSGIVMPEGTELDFVGSVAFSLELWVNEDVSSTDTAFVLDHEDHTVRHGWDLNLQPGSGTSALSGESWYDGSIQSVVFAAAAVPLGAFHYVVMTFDGTTQTLYVDAKIAATPNVIMTMTQAVSIPWRIAKQNCDPCANNGVVGVLDEIAVYLKPLSDQQIMAHYAAASQH
jgi:hypothetical protein